MSGRIEARGDMEGVLDHRRTGQAMSLVTIAVVTSTQRYRPTFSSKNFAMISSASLVSGN